MTGCEALAGLALFMCFAREPRCLPEEHRRLLPELAAVAERESGFRPFAVRDEATGEGLLFATREAAIAAATVRDAAGHTLGLGWFQITHRANWRRHGLTVETALDPCENMRAGAAHLTANLRDAAFQLYNSGRRTGAPDYAASVAARAARLAPRLVAGPAAPVGDLPKASTRIPATGRGHPSRNLVTTGR